MNIAQKVLRLFVVLHAIGAAFAIAQYLFFPEQVVDLIPDDISLSEVRYALALFAVLWYPLKRLFKPKHGKNAKH